MRALSRGLLPALIVGISLGAATGAAASLLTLVGGSLAIGIGPFPAVQFPMNVSAVSLSVSSGGGSFTEPASIFTGTAMLPTALFTGVPIINGLTLGSPFFPVANGTNVVAQGAVGGGHGAGVLRAGGGFGGPGPLVGSAVVNALGLINLHVPLGAIGNTGDSTSVFAGTLVVTVEGTGWTTGVVTVEGVTTGSPATNTVLFAGYDNRTPAHDGVVQLVSPFKVITSVVGNLPGLATQTLTFTGGVPEPGTLALLGLGGASLAALGWLRRRR
jgi:hypothetical protein